MRINCYACLEKLPMRHLSSTADANPLLQDEIQDDNSSQIVPELQIDTNRTLFVAAIFELLYSDV